MVLLTTPFSARATLRTAPVMSADKFDTSVSFAEPMATTYSLGGYDSLELARSYDLPTWAECAAQFCRLRRHSPTTLRAPARFALQRTNSHPPARSRYTECIVDADSSFEVAQCREIGASYKPAPTGFAKVTAAAKRFLGGDEWSFSEPTPFSSDECLVEADSVSEVPECLSVGADVA